MSTEELRAALRDWARTYGFGGEVVITGTYEDVADALIAGPLAAVIADADNWRRVTTGDPTEPEPLAMQARELLVRCRELEATVARVREEIAWLEAANWRETTTLALPRLRRALDGEPQP